MEQSLIEQRNTIPALIDSAIEDGLADEIVRLKRKHELLQTWIDSERMVEIRKLINDKEKQRNECNLREAELTSQLADAKLELDNALAVAERKYEAHGKTQIELFALDQSKITLHESVRDLTKELDELKRKLEGGLRK